MEADLTVARSSPEAGAEPVVPATPPPDGQTLEESFSAEEAAERMKVQAAELQWSKLLLKSLLFPVILYALVMVVYLIGSTVWDFVPGLLEKWIG